MNKIFKTKRSRKFDAVVAVSELSSNHQKVGEAKPSVASKSLLALFVGMVLTSHADAAWNSSWVVAKPGYVGPENGGDKGVWFNPTNTAQFDRNPVDANG